MRSTQTKSAPLLPTLVRILRGKASIRAFSRRMGISHSIVTRIESEEVRKPRRDVLLKLAASNFREPAPLLYAAGHLSGEEFRQRMKPLFTEQAALAKQLDETHEEGGAEGLLTSEEARLVLARRDSSGEDLGRVAVAAFSLDQDEPARGERFIAAQMLTEGDEEQAATLIGLIDQWSYIQPEAREALLDYAESLGRIRDLELSAKEREAELTADAEDDR